MNIYVSGEYLARNPGWHEGDSAWKAQHVRWALEGLTFSRLCEVGSGAGETLRLLSHHYPGAEFCGYEVSPQAHGVAKLKAANGLSYHLGSAPAGFDVAMALDVFEHVDDYPAFLRRMREIAPVQIYHIPLDISVIGVLRGLPMRCRDHLGHIHQFTKETALAALKETGHHIVKWRYTNASADLPKTRLAKLAAAPRKALGKLAPDTSARLLGGYSMMVLCH